MGHRTAHGRQGRHHLAELIGPRLALLVFAALAAVRIAFALSKIEVLTVPDTMAPLSSYVDPFSTYGIE